MKSENLNSFNTLSNLVGKGKNLVVQSTRTVSYTHLRAHET